MILSKDAMPPPDETNPYAAPKAELRVEEQIHDYEYPDASGGKRFLNYLIDLVCGIGFIVLLAALTGVLEGFGVISGSEEWLESMGPLEERVFYSLLLGLYYVLMEGLFGRTIGKLVTGTKVIGLDGLHPGWGTIILRSLARLVPFEPFSFLASEGSGWHDRWTDTRVIDLRTKPEGQGLRRRLRM
jgi:uncharacterized RDD family membrane protein YckC